jgi:hypothetical protein
MNLTFTDSRGIDRSFPVPQELVKEHLHKKLPEKLQALIFTYKHRANTMLIYVKRYATIKTPAKKFHPHSFAKNFDLPTKGRRTTYAMTASVKTFNKKSLITLHLFLLCESIRNSITPILY